MIWKSEIPRGTSCWSRLPHRYLLCRFQIKNPVCQTGWQCFTGPGKQVLSGTRKSFDEML